MSRLTDALFSPSHAIVTILTVAGALTAFTLDALGIYKPDYRRLLAVVVVCYFAFVLGEWKSNKRT